MDHPYQGLSPEAYWRTAVSDLNPLETANLYEPKQRLKPSDRVVTFGSCFAQHISRALRQRGFSWLDCEPAPELVSDALKNRYNYGVFSARTGNIYSAKALLQWVRWSLGIEAAPDEIWEQSGRFYDPFRPAIEPDGFASVEEVTQSRAQTLHAFRRCILEADVFVFTLGLTESWEARTQGYAFATCPGTNAGTFDVEAHVFRNHTAAEVQAHLNEALQLIVEANPAVRILLTVSPVPLTATASGRHVIVATTYSKSVLRAVAGQFADEWPNVDYFPSYEIITAPSFRGMFYSPNMRGVSDKGVEFVMGHFMRGLDLPTDNDTTPVSSAALAVEEDASEADDDIKCEEAILEAFAHRGKT